MLQFGGYPYAMLALLSAFCTQIAFFSSTLWLAVWTGAYTKEGAINLGFYLGCYACILLTFNLMVPLNNTVFQYGAWRAARTLHTRLTNSVLNVPIKWFDSNPVGTVLNRFSSDMASLDSIIVGWLRMTLDNQIRLCLRIGAIASVLPIFALPAAVLCSIGFGVGEVYTRCQISIKRLTSASNSPIFAHFSETIAGLPTIRAQHGMGEVFGLVLAGHMANYARAYEALYNSNRWVSVRADVIAASVAACAGSIAVVKSQSISAGLVGFSLTNAIGLSQTILQMVRNMNELEVELNSFQRVMEYGGLKSEAEEIEAAAAEDSSSLSHPPTPASWPSSGKVEFRNFSAGYSKDGPSVLKNITFEAVPGERIGIIGRTGSGKTSLGMSLLRFTTQSAGSISIDNIDISAVDLTRLRQAITIIPQEPTLFAGDVRSNLDPFGEMEDTELNDILRACGCLGDNSPSIPLNNKVNELRGRSGESSTSSNANSRNQSPQSIRLSTPVTTGGANFSAGQRQIICMARAICRRSKVVLLDEATSSVDSHTDLRIQNVLRTEFKGSTIFTVAHRLDTIADYDRVLVLSAGEIVEVDNPRRLYEKKGVFWNPRNWAS
jgi:ABC-type multidrug transport system fused ATPase/permease subunit